MPDIKPSIWGPSVWFFLNVLAESYDDNPTFEYKQNMKNYIISLGNVLPCEKCRYNFINNHYKNFPLTDYYLENRDNFKTWVITFHNLINKNLNKSIHKNDNKKSLINDFEWNGSNINTNHGVNYNNYAIIFSVIFIVIIVIIGAVIYNKQKNKNEKK